MDFGMFEVNIFLYIILQLSNIFLRKFKNSFTKMKNNIVKFMNYNNNKIYQLINNNYKK